MQKETLSTLCPIVGSTLITSRAAPPLSQTTTIRVEVPATTETKTGAKMEATQQALATEVVDARPVRRITWPYAKTPGALDFCCDNSDSADLRAAADSFFSHKLGKVGGANEVAFLPREELVIHIGVDTELPTNYADFICHYNRDFGVGEPAFTRIKD